MRCALGFGGSRRVNWGAPCTVRFLSADTNEEACVSGSQIGRKGLMAMLWSEGAQQQWQSARSLGGPSTLEEVRRYLGRSVDMADPAHQSSAQAFIVGADILRIVNPDGVDAVQTSLLSDRGDAFVLTGTSRVTVLDRPVHSHGDALWQGIVRDARLQHRSLDTDVEQQLMHRLIVFRGVMTETHGVVIGTIHTFYAEPRSSRALVEQVALLIDDSHGSLWSCTVTPYATWVVR